MGIKDQYILSPSDEFALKPGEEVSVNLMLEKAPPPPCTKLLGQVRGECGTIAGATVKILDQRFNPLYHTDTDSNGNFSFYNTLMPGDYEIVAVAEDYLVSKNRSITLTPFLPLYVTIYLSPDKDAKYGTVYGIVRDEKNEPLPGVQIFIYDTKHMELPKIVTLSNRDGEYLVYGINPGQYCIKAFLQGYWFPDSITLTVCPKEPICADLYLYRDASAYKGTISGEVTYHERGVPYAVTALYQIHHQTCTLIQIQKANDKGFYLFSGLNPGQYVVKAKLEGELIRLCDNRYVD